MKKLALNKLALAFSILAFGAPGASAADLATRPYAKAPVVDPVSNWSGFYLGATAGYSWNKLTVNDLDYWDGFGDSSTQSNGGAVGGTFGVNWQMRHLVYGIESDISWLSNSRTSNNSLSTSTLPSAQITSKIDALATIRGRVGIAVDPALLYLTGGVAFGQVKNSYTDRNFMAISLACPGCTSWSDNGWRTGFVVGAGVESALGSNWSMKVETLYYQLSDHTVEVAPYFTNTSRTFRQRFDDAGLIARLGVNYRFDSGTY